MGDILESTKEGLIATYFTYYFRTPSTDWDFGYAILTLPNKMQTPEHFFIALNTIEKSVQEIEVEKTGMLQPDVEVQIMNWRYFEDEDYKKGD